MIQKFKATVTAILAMGFVAGFACTSLAGQTVWRLAHVAVAEADNPYHATSLKFKELVEKGTDGRVQIKIFPQRQLGNDREILEGVQAGLIDVSAATLGPVAAFEPSVAMMELPFLYKNPKHLDTILDGPVGRKILDKLENAGFKGLGFFDDGINNITNSRRPIHSAADFKGLQMRTIESPVRISTARALGANPIPVPYSELYTALQTGVVDGQSNPNWVISARSLWEVQKYVSITQHIWGGAILLVSNKKFAKLSEADQKTVMEAGLAACKFGRDLGRASEEKHLEKAIEKGMTVDRTPDITSMQQATNVVYEDIYKEHPDWTETIKTIREM
ncbi:TRAP transporter substrate-binding protein [Desulforhopalus vacuolatus]|uniref:TRAP transporter substrate-binding protein n=1 Tax=Desulforhopalus vacuolatus TaxID=40414 RepID=UPI0019643E74|nr:TRAP transporter substrate-binding protein [Desulforhopalus vacuolatus]MBM9518202.1 TRAP transporter substrate-binding protein [Desulforhopalus vacuolatus]